MLLRGSCGAQDLRRFRRVRQQDVMTLLPGGFPAQPVLVAVPLVSDDAGVAVQHAGQLA
jgi:hypothetical protein